MINRESIATEWSEKVLPVHPVPEKLHAHQLDAMSLLKQGENVFLSMLVIVSLRRRIQFHLH